MPQTALLPGVRNYIEGLQPDSIASERRALLDEIATYIRENRAAATVPQLHFICTHNSRRSQFGQVWCRAVGAFFGVNVLTFSGGTEVTAVHPQVMAMLRRTGLKISSVGEHPPVYNVAFSESAEPIQLFSKLYDHPENPQDGFAAAMTCSHADTNCPLIPGAEKRFALHYPDPKVADGTAKEDAAYEWCSRRVATEMMFLFQSMIKHDHNHV